VNAVLGKSVLVYSSEGKANVYFWDIPNFVKVSSEKIHLLIKTGNCYE